jgi:hypothetical protein
MPLPRLLTLPVYQETSLTAERLLVNYGAHMDHVDHNSELMLGEFRDGWLLGDPNMIWREAHLSEE